MYNITSTNILDFTFSLPYLVFSTYFFYFPFNTNLANLSFNSEVNDADVQKKAWRASLRV